VPRFSRLPIRALCAPLQCSLRFACVRGLLSVLLLSPLAAGPAAAQLLRGRVIHAGDGMPVPDVAVLILSDTTVVLAIVTDDRGHFETTLAQPGTYRVSASRSGYETVGPAPLEVPPGRMIDLVIRMANNIVVLDPLEVRASRQPLTRLDEARDRIARNRRFGIGIHMTRAEIQASQRNSMSELLRFRRTERTRCIPALFVDGARVHDYVDDLDGIIAPGDVEALEVYSGPHVRGGFQDPAGCGLLLVWSRRDARGNYKFTWIGSGIIAGVLTVIYLGW
jgi:hypothetical protein